MSRRLLAIAAASLAALPGACAAPSQGNGPPLPASFTALGTEPFWAAKVEGAILLYQTPEDQAGRRVAVTRRTTDVGAELSGTLDGAPLILAIGPGPCSDGMSDTVYSHSAELRIGRELLKGCAKPH